MLKKILLLYILTMSGLLLPALAQTQSEEIILHQVNHDTPFFERPKTHELGSSYSIKMIKIDGNSGIVKPPLTSAKVLYYGQVRLGSPPVDYGILFDLEGKTKQLWVDYNGNGDYTSQPPLTLYKSEKYAGINVFYSPAPITFNVKYTSTDHTYPIPIQFELPYLIVAQAGYDDFFYLKTRTWFTGEIPGNDDDIAIALVDSNDNGNYNDPDDLVFIDWNYDLNFTVTEGIPLKSWKSMTLPSKLKYKIEYMTAPEKIILNKG